MGSLFGRWLGADNSNETAGENSAGESGLFLFLVPQSATILDKTVEKIAYLEGIFSKLRSRPILPSPLPLEAVLLGLQKKAGSLSICRKQL